MIRAATGRRMTGTGTCIGLIAAGLILRFAVGAGTLRRYVPVDVSESALTEAGDRLLREYPGLDVHAVGVIVIGAGELGLLSLLVWGPLNPAWRHRHST